MIIKNLTRKKTGTGQLIRYIFRYMLDEEKQLNQGDKEQALVIRHNVRNRTVEGFIKAFKENEKNRIIKRKDQTIIHHTILSWSHKDATHITDKMLLDITRKFIRLRGETNLYVGTKHTDRNHVHLHIAVSGSQINGRSSRMSKKAFADLKLSLDTYQKEKYPELVHSLPFHGRSSLSKEIQLGTRHLKSRESEKESILKTMEEACLDSISLEEFLENLKTKGLEL